MTCMPVMLQVGMVRQFKPIPTHSSRHTRGLTTTRRRQRSAWQCPHSKDLA
jgi:hypothetical protein